MISLTKATASSLVCVSHRPSEASTAMMMLLMMVMMMMMMMMVMVMMMTMTMMFEDGDS